MSLVIWTFPVLQIQFGPNPSFTGDEDPIFDGLHMSKIEEGALVFHGSWHWIQQWTECLSQGFWISCHEAETCRARKPT